MMLLCIPFLLFDGNCAEAMTLYHKCLEGLCRKKGLQIREVNFYDSLERYTPVRFTWLLIT